MIKTKNLLSIIIAAVLISSSCFIASATDTAANLLNIYSDGMLFLQNSEAVISGKGHPDNIISLSLYDKHQNIIAESDTKVASDGTFKIVFNAPSGSFDEYSIVLKENGKTFDTLENIVFGELWLASGQSNMQYPLIQTKTGKEMLEKSENPSKWLRVLLVPPYPQYKNSTELIPAQPMDDIIDAEWVTGENVEIYNMSAVAYFFAEALMNRLDMPVGILNSSLGGSSIRSWLSREAIDNNPSMKKYLTERGEYIELSDWNESGQNIYYDMTANYNQKIAPLKDFHISGMIWYQGETDLILGNTQYGNALNILQESYTELFNFQNGLLPLVFTQLASYNYSDDPIQLSNWNLSFTEMQREKESSRALITIYDIPLSFLPEAGLIHPECKEEVGRRMAYAAEGLIYNKNDAYTAATVKKTEIFGNEIFITFNNTGSGLMLNGPDAIGFAVCGDNGIYVSADAEIISPDTIKVYSDYVLNPKAVSYAFCNANGNSNLYSSSGGILALPVAPFITDSEYTQNIWEEKTWTRCDNDTTWHTEDDKFSGFYDTWVSPNSEITYSTTDSADNTNGLNIISDKCTFYISPLSYYKDNISKVVFSDFDTDFSKYGKISFLIRNNGENDIVFEGLRLYQNPLLWYSPEITDTLDVATVIPADGNWHLITLNLNKLYHLGNECSLSYTSSKLASIEEIRFVFSGDFNNNTNISFDNVRFSPTEEADTNPFEVNLKNADNAIEFFTGIILSIINKFAMLFSF